MEIGLKEQRQLRQIGITGTDLKQVKAELTEKLRPYLTDVDKVRLKELIMLGNAVLAKPSYTIDTPIKKSRTPTIPKPKDYTKDIQSRKRVRINLLADPSYAMPLMEHLSRFDGVRPQEVNTGLSIKHGTGYGEVNIITYNHLRCLKGVVHGHLFFNVVRNDDQFYTLNIDREHKYFRGYAMVSSVCIYDLLDILTDSNVTFLKELADVSQSRKQRNVQALKVKLG